MEVGNCDNCHNSMPDKGGTFFGRYADGRTLSKNLFCSKECRVADFKVMVASRKKAVEVNPETGEIQV